MTLNSAIVLLSVCLTTACVSATPVQNTGNPHKQRFAVASSFMERLNASEELLFDKEKEKKEPAVQASVPKVYEKKNGGNRTNTSIQEQWYRLKVEKKPQDVYEVASEKYDKIFRNSHADKREMIPELREWRLLVAASELSLFKFKEGKNKLEGLIEDYPQWSSPYLILSQFYFSQRMFELSKLVSIQGLELGDELKEDLLLLAVKSINVTEGPSVALEFLTSRESYFKDYKVTSLIYLEQGNLEEQIGKSTEACMSFKKASDFHFVTGQQPQVYLLQGRCFIREKDWNAFEEALAQAQKRFPGNVYTKVLTLYDDLRKGNKDGASEKLVELKKFEGQGFSQKHQEIFAILERSLQSRN